MVVKRFTSEPSKFITWTPSNTILKSLRFTSGMHLLEHQPRCRRTVAHHPLFGPYTPHFYIVLPNSACFSDNAGQVS